MNAPDSTIGVVAATYAAMGVGFAVLLAADVITKKVRARRALRDRAVIAKAVDERIKAQPEFFWEEYEAHVQNAMDVINGIDTRDLVAANTPDDIDWGGRS